MSWLVRIFHIIVIGSFVVGVVTLLGIGKTHECKMTYMWEYPEYAKIPLDQNATDSFPNYHLHFYGEGQYMRWFDPDGLIGIPVLFIPGNGGCFRQARSIGSVLLRKAENIGWRPHFNVFTVDLNGELVGIYGGTLNSQVKFVNLCIKKILSMYSNSKKLKFKPTSVVLVGHSMGGIVAKSIFADSEFLHGSVHTILTFGSPHKAPVISLDNQISEFYKKNNQYWKDNWGDLKNINVLSVAGGQRDYQVNPALTEFPICTEPWENQISTIATHVPQVHASPDHQCIVWCNQLVLATARALFEMIDEKTQQITGDSHARNSILQHYFVRNPGYKAFAKKIAEVQLNKAQEIIGVSTWTISKKPKKGVKFIVFNVDDFIMKQKDMLIAKTETSKGQWVFLKHGEDNVGKDISSQAHETPQFIVLKLNLTQLQNEGYKQIVFNYKAALNLKIDIINSNTSSQHVTVPYSLSQLWYGQQIIIIPPTDVYHKLYLNGFNSIFHAYSVSLLNDNPTSNDIFLEYDVPWKNGYFFTEQSNISLTLPSLSPQQNHALPSLNIYKHGNENVSLLIKADFVQLMANLLRIYLPSIISMIVCNILLVYTSQLKSMLYQSSVICFANVHSSVAKPYKIQPFISLTKVLYSVPLFLSIWTACKLPKPDCVILEQDLNVWFSFAPFCMFIFAYEFVKIANSWLRFTVEHLELICGLLVKGNIEIIFRNNALPIHILLVSIILYQGPSMVLFYIFIMQLLKTSMFAVRHFKFNCETESKEKDEQQQLQSEYEINYTMLLMWTCLLLCFLPSHIGGIKGYSNPDIHEYYHTTLATLLYFANSRSSRNLRKSSTQFLSWLCFPAIVLCSLICFISLFRLSTFILFFITLHTVMIYF